MALPNLNTGGLCDILSAQIVHDLSIIFFPLGRKTYSTTKQRKC